MKRFVDYDFYARRGAPVDTSSRPARVFILAPIHMVTSELIRKDVLPIAHMGPIGFVLETGTVVRLPDVPA